jgi:hypothetical protein
MAEDSMTQRESSAAQALFPHLRQGTPEIIQREQPTLANALYPSLAPPKPPTYSEVKQLWVDRMLELSGLKRRR